MLVRKPGFRVSLQPQQPVQPLAGKAAADEQQIDPERLVQHHDQPEGQLIAQLAGLVAKDLLRDERARPAAGQLS